MKLYIGGQYNSLLSLDEQTLLDFDGLTLIPQDNNTNRYKIHIKNQAYIITVRKGRIVSIVKLLKENTGLILRTKNGKPLAFIEKREEIEL